MKLRPLLAGLLGVALGCGGEPESVGTAADPIVGGRPAEKDELVATVAVLKGGLAECSGALIADTLVVTAAHCVAKPTESGGFDGVLDAGFFQVVAGELNTAGPVAEAAAIEVEEVAIADFTGDIERDLGDNPEGLGTTNDIALLHLAEPVPETLLVAPILPVAELDELVGDLVLLSGYGLDGNGEQAVHGTLHVASAVLHRHNGNEAHIGGDGVDTCPGDSGGPAYWQDGSTFHLIGVASRSVDYENESCGAGTVFTLAGRYREWIAGASKGKYPPGGSATEVPPDEGCSIARPGKSKESSLLWLAFLAAAVLRRRR